MPPTAAEIPALMGDFGRWLSAATAMPGTAFTAHEQVAVIHPFADGNGRTARLLMNLLLLKAGWPPVVIGPEQRADYIGSLDALTVGRDADPYREFMAARLEQSLEHHPMISRRGVESGPMSFGMPPRE